MCFLDDVNNHELIYYIFVGMKVYKTSTSNTELKFGRTKVPTGCLNKTTEWGFFYKPAKSGRRKEGWYI